MNTKITIVVFMLVVALASSVRAGPFDDASAAYHRGDFATALRLIRPLAEQGDARAQTNLGVLYENGQGVPQDDAEAAKWYRKAADKGHASAQYKLGVLYWLGQGVPEDGDKALQWYRRAAHQGHADAQNTLGVMSWTGRGAPQDDAEAVKWFRKAAEQGHANAAKNLRLMAEKTRPATIKTPPASAVKTPSASALKEFRVQLSAVKSEADAAQEAQRLIRVHKSVLGDLNIALVRADLGERGVFYRLRAGPFKDRAAAASLCRELSARRQGCTVIAPPSSR